MEILQEKVRSIDSVERVDLSWQRLNLLPKIKSIGMNDAMEDYEKRKLGIFNLLNFFQFVACIIIPLIGFITTDKFSLNVWLIACLPAFTSIVSLYLNYRRKYEMALLAFFILYPFLVFVP